MQSAPSDYADLMDELAECETPSAVKVFRLGTVARRNVLPVPYRQAVNSALEARERVVANIVETPAGLALLRVEGAGYMREAAL